MTKKTWAKLINYLKCRDKAELSGIYFHEFEKHFILTGVILESLQHAW